MILTTHYNFLSLWHILLCLFALSLLHWKVRLMLRAIFNFSLVLIRKCLHRIFVSRQYSSGSLEDNNLKKPFNLKKRNSPKAGSNLRSSSFLHQSYVENDDQNLSLSAPVRVKRHHVACFLVSTRPLYQRAL